MDPSDVVIAITTHPEAGADALAEALVSRRVAACVQVLPAVRSTYRWRGALATAAESRLEIKTRAGLVPALEAALAELHPYEVPELVVLRVAAGSPAYLDWVREETP